MPITGIESILCRDLTHFEPMLFHNNPVVVDGEDFVEFFSRGPFLSNVWGGEYLALAVSWTKQLEDLRKCAIDPLFIFSAGTERRGKQLEYQLTGAEKKVVCLKRLEKQEVTAYVYQILPVLVNNLLVDLLDGTAISHLCSPFAVQRSCASLASRMQCALLGSSHEYLLLCAALPNRKYAGFDYIPFQYLNTVPVPLQDDKKLNNATAQRRHANHIVSISQFALSVHKFLPEFTSLRKIDPAYRPMVFLLLGSDAMPRIRLPKSLQVVLHKEAGSDYKTRRWNTIIFWLSQFKPGSIQPVEQIMACYPSNEQQPWLRNFIECVLDYLPDPIICRRLSSFLLEAPKPHQPTTPERVILDPLSSDIDKDHQLDDSMDKKTFISKVFQGYHTSKLPRFDFTSGWPANLVRVFHQSQFASYLFTPLYCPGGVVLPIVVENPKSSTSVWDAALSLRLLFYRLLSGLEHQLGQPEKLIGLKPCATEYVRHGTAIVRYNIPVDPFLLDSKKDKTDKLLETALNLPTVDTGTNLDTLLSLALSLSLWHRWRLTNDQQALLSPEKSPLMLAVGLCAVANSFNLIDITDMELVKHYGSILSFAENMLNNNEETSSAATPAAKHALPVTFRLDYVHDYNSIQIIYACFKSVIVLLDQLVPTESRSACYRFLPPWKVFPSGRLVHWLAACIANQEPGMRLHYASRFWLPRLIRVQQQTANAASLLQRGVNLFNAFINKICAIVEKLSPAAPIDYVKQNIPPVNLDTFKPTGNENGVIVVDDDSVDLLEYVEPSDDSRSSTIPRTSSPSPHYLSPEPSHFHNEGTHSRATPVTQQQKREHTEHLSHCNKSVPNIFPDSEARAKRRPFAKNFRGGHQSSSYAERLRQRLLLHESGSK